jgi:hypothetical protein
MPYTLYLPNIGCPGCWYLTSWLPDSLILTGNFRDIHGAAMPMKRTAVEGVTSVGNPVDPTRSKARRPLL